MRRIYRWIVFLLAAGYCLRTLILGDFGPVAGPFRFLTIWALFMSFFAASRMMALEEGRSDNRWDGFVCMVAVINAMVVFMYWRLFIADPGSVTTTGMMGEFYLEMYLHGLGPALQIIDTLFIHRAYRQLRRSAMWLIGVIGVYICWAELVVQRFNDTPMGTVTSGLPYPFLNNLDLPERAVFYGTNFAAGFVLLFVFAAIGRVVSRIFPAQKAHPDRPGNRGKAV